MSTSLPSKEIYSVDVPIVDDFEAKFQYNFFIKDEMVSEIAPQDQRYATRPAASFDSDFIEFITTRVPRFVVLSFKTPRQLGLGNKSTADDVKKHNHSAIKASTLIADNLNKVVNIDMFSSQNFVAMHFHDGEIDDKVYEFVSGSFTQRTLSNLGNSYRDALSLGEQTSNEVSPHLLYKGMDNHELAYGVSYFDDRGNKSADEYFKRLKSVSIDAQVNSKLLFDVLDRASKDPNSSYTTDLLTARKKAKDVQRSAKNHYNPSVSDRDYKVVVPYIDASPSKSSHTKTTAELVGCIIDKTEILPNGGTKEYPPIIVESPRAAQTVDLRVRYGATYAYTVRTVAQFTVPAINDDTGSVHLVKMLVSSKPSATVYVKCVEEVAPPPPTDVDFVWDYGTQKLMVVWTFPPNSQRDIKKFQLFRRDKIEQPFELIQMWDFDDSVIKTISAENPKPSLVKTITDPVTFYVDPDFGKDSSYIYSLAAVDAHGFVSNYSAQFQLSFDKFKNRLVKKLISHTGAPRQYPNLYLEADAFANTMRDSGHTRLKLYFNPEYYYIADDMNRLQPAVAMLQDNGRYKLSLINLDVQKQQIIDVTVNNRLTNKPA